MSPPRVAFFSPNWGRPGPLRLGWSDYWRLALPAVELHRNGWDVVLGRAVGPAGDGRLAVMDPDRHWWEDRDVLVFHRWMSKDAPRLIREAREAGQVLINDVDDLLQDMPPGHPGHEQLNRPDYNLGNWEGTLRESSLLTTSTPYLATSSAAFGPPVRTVRNYVDVSAWEPRPPGRYVGWVGSTAGRGEDLAILRESVVPWLRDHGLPFYHGGVIPGEPKMRDVLGYPNVVTRPFQPPQTYPRLWDPLRVALCPLGDHPFARAKSYVKPLEACARGIPFVASDHPEYRELEYRFLAKSPGDWVSALDALMVPGAPEAGAKSLRRRAEERSIQRNWSEWADVLGSPPSKSRSKQELEERSVAT